MSDCKACADRGWLVKMGRIVECPHCLGKVPVANLPPEQVKS